MGLNSCTTLDCSSLLPLTDRLNCQPWNHDFAGNHVYLNLQSFGEDPTGFIRLTTIQKMFSIGRFALAALIIGANASKDG
jgi:hypothetical protein